MIDRLNYLLLIEYLAYCLNVLLNSPKTISAKRSRLLRLLRWGGETPLFACPQKSPAFINYLVTDCGLAGSTVRSTLSTVKHFFTWLRQTHPKEYDTPELMRWVDSLVFKKRGRSKRNPFRLSEVEKIIALEFATHTELRDAAMTALGFASGARVGALMTLPIKAIHLEHDPPKIYQWPSLGVATKNQKSSTTFLPPLPPLLAIIQRWDAIVRSQLPADALWYSSVTTDGMDLRLTTETNEDRSNVFRDGLRELCDRAGIPYRPPHQLRHGHAVFVNRHSHHPSRREAVMHNLMHEPKDITDLYLTPPEDIIIDVYRSLNLDKDESTAQLLKLAMEMLERAEKKIKE